MRCEQSSSNTAWGTYIPTMQKATLVLGLLLPLALAAQTAPQRTTNPKAAAKQLSQLFETVEGRGWGAQDSLGRGKHPVGAWRPVTDELMQAQADSAAALLAQLDAIPEAGLSRQERVSREVMRIKLRDEVDEVRYRMHLIPFNAEGGFYNRLSYSLHRLPFNTVADFEAYLAWLPEYVGALRQNMTLLRQGLAEGIIAPQPVVRNTLELLKTWDVDAVEDSPLYEPFEGLPAGFSESEKTRLLANARMVIGEVNATYGELREFVAGDYLVASPEQPGIGTLPGGRAYYENRVRHYTTLPLSADSVHAIGLREVARIRASMDSIIAAVGFEGSFADFLAFLRTDPQFFATTPEELLRRAAWISKRAEGQLPKYFAPLYSLPFTVEPVPAGIAPTYTTGRYVGGSRSQNRAGIYWVNTYDLPSRTLYTLPALTLHEAVPGHHLQTSLAAEIEGLPKFRTDYYISAFGEGWGLYSEYLGEEMGMYETAYELFGRYTYEMWRACRLVVDSGIHAGGWSRARALAYLSENTALSLHECRTEIDRYIGWPGQALSYKIGELEIKRLRARAEAQLGDRFDIRAFHRAVLQNGSVPLPVLAEQIEAYIEAAR